MLRKRAALQQGRLGAGFYLFKKRRRNVLTEVDPPRRPVEETYRARAVVNTRQKENVPCPNPHCWGKKTNGVANLVEIRGVCRQCYDRWYRIKKNLAQRDTVSDFEQKEMERIEAVMSTNASIRESPFHKRLKPTPDTTNEPPEKPDVEVKVESES